MPYLRAGSRQMQWLKDVPTSIPKSDLLGVTMTVIHVAGQRFFVV